MDRVHGEPDRGWPDVEAVVFGPAEIAVHKEGVEGEERGGDDEDPPGGPLGSLHSRRNYSRSHLRRDWRADISSGRLVVNITSRARRHAGGSRTAAELPPLRHKWPRGADALLNHERPAPRAEAVR